MIMSTARDYIDPKYEEEYMVLIHELINKTRLEDGNISYTLYCEQDVKGCFVLLEFWKDRESLNKHFETEHFRTIVPEIQKLQTKASVVNVYEELY